MQEKKHTNGIRKYLKIQIKCLNVIRRLFNPWTLFLVILHAYVKDILIRELITNEKYLAKILENKRSFSGMTT